MRPLDSTLWEKIRQGDKEAFMQLYKGLYPRLFAFGCRVVYNDQETVKDCLHEMFCEIWSRHSQLPDVTQVQSYLLSYLKRKILTEVASPGQSSESVMEELLPSHVHTISYEDLLVQTQSDQELKQRLKKTFERLTSTQQTIIRLKFYEELSYEQIAEQLHIQPRTVYNQVYEALKVLRKNLSSVAPISVLLHLLF